MKKTILSIFALMGLSAGMNAQNAWVNDTVTMGMGITSDVYYSMENGMTKTENNKNWHLAFSLNPGDSSSVFANHQSGNKYVKVYNIHKAIADWNTVVLDDTLTATLCFNNDLGWYQGALNDIPSADMFNFGWGTYAGAPSHDVVGDSIFIVKANNVFYKFFINSLVGVGADAGNWNIQVGDFNGNTTMDTIKKANYPNRLFAYYDLSTMLDSNREPDMNTWDIVFNRYTTNDPLSGPSPNNNVVGVLGNKGIKFAKAMMVHVDTAYFHYADYANPDWSKVISSIGFNWKSYDQPNDVYITPDSLSYFVLDKSNKVYQLQFTEYGYLGQVGGGANGTVKFRKRLVADVTKVEDVQSALDHYLVFPNPAQNIMNVLLDAKESAEANLQILDLTGKIVYSSSIKLANGMNVYALNTENLSNGNYILSVHGSKIHLKEKISVVK